jgi:hypothetical protein
MMNGHHANPLKVPADTVPVRSQAGRIMPPAAPVRVAIPVHQRSEGKHRLRISLNRDTAHRLAHGLRTPRLHVTGTVETGFRLWCTDHGGYAPVLSKSGEWYLSLSIRRVHGRERAVPTEPAPHHWERDDTGPVLIIDPLPGHFHRGACHHPPKPPAETAMAAAFAAADQKLKEAMAEAAEAEPEPEPPPAKAEPCRPVLTLAYKAEPKAEPAMPDPDPAPRAVNDLRTAIQLVNELMGEAGEGVTLVVQDDGRLSAKRRVIHYVDL